MLSSIIRNERVIIVEDDRIRSVVIGPGQRLRPTLLIILALLGMGATGFGWLITAIQLSRTWETVGHVQQGADLLTAQLKESRALVADLAEELDEAQTALAKAAESLPETGETGALRETVTQTQEVIRQTSLRLAAQRALAARIAVDRAENLIAGPAPDMESMVEGLAHTLVETQAETTRLRADAEAARREQTEMLARMREAEAHIAAMTDGNVALLTRLTEHADLRIGEIETGLRDFGLDLDRVLEQMDGARNGTGGPLVGVPDLPPHVPPAALQALAQLESRLARQAKLRDVYSLLPLSPPVDNFYVSSGYGRRRDPFTSQPAQHQGMDLVAKLGSPVMATAPGTVAEVRWDEGYGRLVEVDHGFGIRTRYGHLGKTTVKRGDRVEHGQPIGELGSSGRSNGPHVHYEILMEGRPLDPLRFMEKGRHVCES